MTTQSRARRAGIVTQTKRTPERVERRETFLRRRPAEDFATEDTLLLTTPDEMTAQGANDNGASSFYFRVNPDGDNYATFNTGANVAMRLSLHYLDVGTETLTIGYSTNGSSENATKTLVTKTDTGRWLWAHKKITARVNHSIYSSQDNADFRVYSTAAFYANGARLRANAEQVIVNWKADQFDDDLRDENAYYGDDPDLIGAWAISETYLIYDTDDDATSAGLAPLDYPFYAGATYANRASAPFRVTPAGALYSTSGQIANWDIGVVDAYTISADNGKVKLNSQTPYISLGNTVGMSAGTPTGKGVFFRKDGGDFDLFAGDINGSDGDKSYVWYDGSAGTWTFHNVPLKGYNTSHVQTWSIDQRGNAWFGKSSSNKLIEWSTTGGTAGDFRAGGNDDYFFWDDSASTAYVKGNVEISGELHTAVFVKGVTRVEAGTLVVATNAGILNAAVTTAAGSQTLNIKDNAGAAIAAVNDILYIKTLAGENYFTVTAVGALSGGARNYTATRNSGSNATFAKGTAVTNLGANTGAGFLLLSADGTGAPYYSVQTHAGSPWSTTTERGRFGNMNGAFGIASNYYGFGVGDYSGGNYLRYETNGGFVLSAGGGNINITGTAFNLTAGGGSALVATDINWSNSGITGLSINSYYDSGAADVFGNIVTGTGWTGSNKYSQLMLQAIGRNALSTQTRAILYVTSGNGGAYASGWHFYNESERVFDIDVGGNVIVGGTSNGNLTWATDNSFDIGASGANRPRDLYLGRNLDVRGAAVFNEDGADVDFRIESDTNTNMFFVDASANRIGIGRTPGKTLDISGTDQPLIRMTYTNASSSSVGPAIDFYINDGAATASADRIGAFQFGGAVDASNTLYASAFVLATATENWSGTAGGSKMTFYTTPNTTQTPTIALTLGQDQSALFTNSIKSSSATAGIGYGTGAGGTVTQATSKSTGVTLNKVSGQITLNNAALAGNTTVSFTLTNSAIAAGDVLLLNHVSGGTAGSYLVNAQCAAGSASINVRNITTGSLSEAIVIHFVVIKAVTA